MAPTGRVHPFGGARPAEVDLKIISASRNLRKDASAQPAISHQAEIVDRFTNSAGDGVVYRRGYWFADNPSKGFGFDKVYHKHGIRNNEAVSATVQFPDSVQNLYGSRWNHRKLARLFTCDLGGCIETQSLTVLVSIEYSDFNGYGQTGIVTAFCEGYNPLCPDWINRAFVPRSATATRGEAPAGAPQVADDALVAYDRAMER